MQVNHLELELKVLLLLNFNSTCLQVKQNAIQGIQLPACFACDCIGRVC